MPNHLSHHHHHSTKSDRDFLSFASKDSHQFQEVGSNFYHRMIGQQKSEKIKWLLVFNSFRLVAVERLSGCFEPIQLVVTGSHPGIGKAYLLLAVLNTACLELKENDRLKMSHVVIDLTDQLIFRVATLKYSDFFIGKGAS